MNGVVPLSKGRKSKTIKGYIDLMSIKKIISVSIFKVLRTT
jgi:hypothetical protein